MERLLFWYKLIFFAQPCNDHMMAINNLFLEVFFIGLSIICLISFLLLYIYDMFSYRVKFVLIDLDGSEENSVIDKIENLVNVIKCEKNNLVNKVKTPVYIPKDGWFTKKWNTFISRYDLDLRLGTDHLYHSSIGEEVIYYGIFNTFWYLINLYLFNIDIDDHRFKKESVQLSSTNMKEDCKIGVYYVEKVRYFSSAEESFLDSFFLILPTLVVILILFPTLSFLYSSSFNLADIKPAFTIDVIGHQWYWTYEYTLGTSGVDISMDSIYDSTQNLSNEYRDDNADFGVIESKNNSFGVDRNLVIPVNTNILLSITSTDVIHSWALPQFGIKVDAVPGKVSHTILFTYSDGIFYGQCSELCGVYHGFMPICVEAVDINLFYSWCFITYAQDLSDKASLSSGYPYYDNI